MRKTAAGDKKDRFPLVTCAALDAADDPRAIIRDCMYADHPAVVGGMFKTLKTLVAVDGDLDCKRMFVSRPFTVAEPLGVVFFSGEGGPGMMQDYGRRIADAKGLRLSDVGNLRFCFTIPKLESLTDLDEVQRIHDETGAAVCFR